MISKTSYINKAKSSLFEVEQLMSVTFKFTKDERLFISIVLKLYDSLSMAMNAYLNIQSEIDFMQKIAIIKTKTDTKLDLSDKDYEFLSEIYTLYKKHKESSIEFTRKEKFIMSGDDYNLHTLTLEKLNNYNQSSKKIVAKLIMAS
jgi:hypothetical protein